MQVQGIFCVPMKPCAWLRYSVYALLPFFPIEPQVLITRVLKTGPCSAYERPDNQILPCSPAASQARNVDSLLPLPLLLTGLPDFLGWFSSLTSIPCSYCTLIVYLLLTTGQARYEAIVTWYHPDRTHQLSPWLKPEESFVCVLKSFPVWQNNKAF